MILTEDDIIEAVNRKDIQITNFEENRLNNCSYNIKLGNNYYEQIDPPRTFMDRPYIVDPFNKSECSKLWKLHENAEEILIPPNRTVLCHTEEFIGSIKGCVPQLRSRSSMMRNMLSIASGAGWGDVGFVGRWAFTITNNSSYHARLVPGCQVAQMIFMKISGSHNDYSGQYSNSYENWNSKSMVPQGTITNK